MLKKKSLSNNKAKKRVGIISVTVLRVDGAPYQALPVALLGSTPWLLSHPQHTGCFLLAVFPRWTWRLLWCHWSEGWNQDWAGCYPCILQSHSFPCKSQNFKGICYLISLTASHWWRSPTLGKRMVSTPSVFFFNFHLLALYLRRNSLKFLDLNQIRVLCFCCIETFTLSCWAYERRLLYFH